MTTIHSTVSDTTITIYQDPLDHDEAVIGLDGYRDVCVKKADLRAAIDAIDPQSDGGAYEREDRHLRHIQDLESFMARRNKRHIQDQERIYELEGEVEKERALRESVATMTPRELLDRAFDAAHVPADGKIHTGEAYLLRTTAGTFGPKLAHKRDDVSGVGFERRLLEPRPEPTEEELAAREMDADLDGGSLVYGKTVGERLAAKGWRKVGHDGAES